MLDQGDIAVMFSIALGGSGWTRSTLCPKPSSAGPLAAERIENNSAIAPEKLFGLTE